MSTTTEENPSMITSFHKNKGIQSGLQKKLASVEPSQAEKLPETALEAQKRHFLVQLLFFPFFIAWPYNQ